MNVADQSLQYFNSKGRRLLQQSVGESGYEDDNRSFLDSLESRIANFRPMLVDDMADLELQQKMLESKIFSNFQQTSQAGPREKYSLIDLQRISKADLDEKVFVFQTAYSSYVDVENTGFFKIKMQ